MKKLFSRLKFLYQYIIGSIGFYPTLIALLFFALAMFMIYLETRGLSERIKENLPFFIITNGETARMVLSSITTGLISLVVFSFTMVMLVLNQASSNFSPRVIPGLITYRSNQKILGLFLGTLLYTLVVMVNIRSDLYSEDLPGLAIFLAMCFTIICLSFFVYFIHSISQSIQIDNILESIYGVTRQVMLQEEKDAEQPLRPQPAFDAAEWHEVLSPRTGHLQSLDGKPIAALCREHQVLVEFMQPLGSFVVEGTPFLRVNRPVANLDSFCEELLDHVNFYQAEIVEVNYLYGFKQITESAVKALSPSINDPGTAVRAIDYLTDLLALRMRLPDEELLFDEEDTARVRLKKEDFGQLCAICLSPIRLYGKGDVVIVLRLLFLLKNLLYKAQAAPERVSDIYRQAELLLHDAGQEIANPGDREKVNRQVSELNSLKILRQSLALLPAKP
ncbi:DUF2254 domain-containing protein [Pontibacter beigongshangensis]|uniref:DUF2254 domain-containing protein n=1 Tax=Pontibacter beigongshangensis TaxID=2574733 RepID=UPI001650BDA1|nr:DUF2254 domain-containing protein [Pontibacter beigongshangensis]